jgi:hypothetical protein
VVAAADEPFIVLLDAEHRGQADQALVVGKDPDDIGAPSDLPVEGSSGFVDRSLVQCSVGSE